jgi:hypothetical protein
MVSAFAASRDGCVSVQAAGVHALAQSPSSAYFKCAVVVTFVAMERTA